jgi:[acyl-carrier-protein] S-malonyltransferase
MSDETKLAVIFPGQGSQKEGMGRDLAEAESWAMEAWKKAEKYSGLPLREIYWDGETGDMARTNALQPALTVVNTNLWRAVHDKLAADFFAGHSLGEFSALFAAKVLTFEEIIELVSLRGKLMHEVKGGAMAAVVKLPLENVEAIVIESKQASGHELVVANYNSPAQFVISGATEAVETASTLAKENRGRAIPLPVSGAFHSPFMAEPAAELAKIIDRMHFKAPVAPVVSNVIGGPESDPAVLADAMRQQMVSGVRWLQSVEQMVREGARSFVEVGPGNVLTKLVQAICKDAAVEIETTTVGTLDEARGL